MAPVVAFIKAGLTFIATAGASGSAMAALTIVTTTLSFAATRMIKNKLNFSVDDNDRSRQTTVRSTTEPRKMVYGETMVSGPLTYAQVSGANNKYLHQVVALAGHELTQISKIFLDDKSIDLTNGSIYNSTTKAVTSGFFGPKNDEGGNSETVVYIDTRLGTASQTAYAGLRSDSVTSQEYLSTHRGDNVASLYTRWTINEGSREVWDEVGNVQNIKALVKGKKIYDPRLEVNAGGTAGASPTNASYVVYDNDTLSTASIDRGDQGKNPALIIADYLMDDEFGLGIPSSKIDWAAIIAAADDCDTLVPIPNSATQKRFFGSGVIFGADPYAKSIQKILSGMNGSLVYSQGKYIVRAGVYVAPTESITENDIIGEVDIRTAIPRSDRLNQIKGLFIDPSEQYKMMEFGPVTVSGAIARDNGEVLEEEIKLPFTDNRYAAQRIAFKQVNQSFLQTMITVPVNLKGMRIAVGDRVNVYLTDLESVDSGSWNPKIFKCIEWSFAENGSGGINLTLIEDVATRYADPVASDYSTITAEGTITTSLPDVPAPTNFSATAAINSIELTWDNPPNTAAWEQIWVYSNTSNTAPTDSSTPIAKFRGTSFTDTVPGGTEKYYWIQAVRYPQGSTPSSGNANKAKSVLVASSPTNVTASKVVNAVMAADSINTAQIVDDAVGSAKIGTTIQSDNWASTSGAAGWQINKAGSATFQTATIKGGITATSGAIGGLTIGSDKVYVGTGTFNNANTAFYVDDQGQLSLKDKLSWDGSALTVSGTVNASSGAFTGDVSTDSKFIAGSGATSATMDGGDPEFKLYAGAAAPADASFKVDSTGIVTATRLVVTRPDDTTAIMFDSAQDGLVGIGLAAVSQETGIVVQNPSVEITSSNPNPALILSASQTITLTLLVGTPATKKATSTGGEYPSDITATIEYSTNSGSSWSTFGSAVQLTKTVTLGSSDATKYGVATSSNTGTGVRAYKRGIHAIDSIGNLQFVRSVSGFAAGSYIFRVSLSQTAGSDTDMNVSTSPPFTLKFATDAAGFTVAANGTLSDAPSATATIGYVQANYMALANGNTITVGSGETNDFQDESGNSVLIVSDTKTEARNTLEVTYTTQYPTSDKIFRIKDYNSTVEKFSIQEDGWVNNWTGIKVGAGYGSTGTTIDASGNISTDGNVVIGGDLTVSGTTTTVNTDDLTVKDPNITLNYSTGDSSSTANNAGITIQDAVDASTDASILWKTASDTFEFSHPVKDLSLTGDFISAGTVYFDVTTKWRVSSTDAANQRADARDEATSYSRLHWYGEDANGATSNFRHAWFDGVSYINVTAASATVTFGGGLSATTGSFSSDLTVTGDVETKIIDQYEEFAAGNGDRTVEYFSKVLATYSEDAGTDTYIILTTSVPQSSSGMGGFQLTFYPIYHTETTGDVIDIYGYWNPESNTGFQGFRYNSKNPNFEPTIQVGADSSGNVVFIISNFGTASYPQLVAKDLWLGYVANNVSRSSGQGWSFSTSNSISAYSNLDTLTRNGVTSAQITNLNTAYNYSQVGHLPLAGGTLTGGLSGTTGSFSSDVSVTGDLKFTGADSYIWSPNTTSGFAGFYDSNNDRIAARYENDTGGWGLLGSPASGYVLKVHGAISSGNIDSSGNIVGTLIESYSAIGASDNVRTGLQHFDTTAMAAGVGGQLVLGYKFTSSGAYTQGAIIKMYKENGTNAQYGSGLKFQVRNNGDNLSTKMTLDPSGNLSATGSLSNNNEINFGSSRLVSSISANTGGGNYELYISPDANNTHQWRIIAGGTNTGYSTGDGGLGFFYQASGTGNSDYNLILKADGTSDFGFDVYANKHLHIGKNGGWLKLYDDQGLGTTTSKGNLYFDATTKEFRFYSEVISSGSAESTATLKRYNGSAYESIYDTGSGVPWADINAGTRTNYTLRFKPAVSNYAGFRFETENANDAGYLLIRSNSDVAPTYKANGIHLIADAGWLSLISRTTTNTGVRILSGATPVERMVFKSDGYIDQPRATWQRTYHQQHEYASVHSANDVHTHWGVLAAGSHSGTPYTYTIIQTNVSQDAYRMGGFTLLVMDNFNDPEQRERIDLAGYWNPESNGGFQGWGYTTTNPALRPTIQIMRNTSTGKVAFAYTHSAASYPVIVACDLWLGFANAIEDDGRDWSMIGASNLNAYTNIDTVNYSGGNGNYQNTDGQFVISKSTGPMLTHGSFGDAFGYNSAYGTYIGGNGNRYVYSGALSSHPIFSDGTNAHNILHNGGQISNTYNGDHTFTTTTTSAGIKVTNNQTGGPALKIHNTATNGTDWWLISNGSANTNGAGLLQLYANNNGFTCATFGATATGISQINTQTRVTATGTPPSFTTTTSGSVTPLLLANSNGQGAHALVVNQTQTSHWAQIISTQAYGLSIDNHASSASYWLFKTSTGGTDQFTIRGDGVTFCKQAFYIGDSSVFGTLQLRANSSSGGTIDAYAPNGSYVHSDVRNNGTWSMAHKYTYKNGSGYGNYTENWWDGNSYHQLGSMSNAIRTNGDFVASGNITAYGTYSDRRLKENIRPFENARELISGINVHRFNYIGKDDDLIGVIAQEVEETLPQLVYELIDTDSDEVRKAVRYDHLSAVLLKAVKEQDEEIKELKEMVKKLMEKIQ